jgi:hypothetical protein
VIALSNSPHRGGSNHESVLALALGLLLMIERTSGRHCEAVCVAMSLVTSDRMTKTHSQSPHNVVIVLAYLAFSLSDRVDQSGPGH